MAREAPDMVFRSLAHHIDVPFLCEAYARTRKDGAPGVDGCTADTYEANLHANLSSLLDRFKSGTYRAPPVRRVHIPKGDGKTRPIGIPTLEDKILQRAVAMVLESIYEQDFLDCSFGFRPKRSAHQALEVLSRGIHRLKGAWLLEVDIKGFFDTLDHHHIQRFLDQRVRDGVLRRTINKWLHAGVQENGCLSYPDAGSPQGGVISPILANIYLHEVLDKWFAQEVLPRLRGAAFLVRYADDFVIAFSQRPDADRVMAALPQRFAKYGLTLHPTKTQLVWFYPGDPPQANLPTTFDLLGFTHYWAPSLRTRRPVMKKKTASSRLTRAIKRVHEWCRDHRHEPIHEQAATLAAKLRGHCAYYGVDCNSTALQGYRFEMHRAWLKWLRRRSQRARRLTWKWFNALLKRLKFPAAKLTYPNRRAASSMI